MKLPSLFHHYANRQVQDLLMAHADALLFGTLDREKLLEPYDNVIREQAGSLIVVAERINQSVEDVVPSDHFVSQLRYNLIETSFPATNWWERLRSLPPRTQWAAGIGGATLTAGVVLIASRSTLEFWRNRRDIPADA